MRNEGKTIGGRLGQHKRWGNPEEARKAARELAMWRAERAVDDVEAMLIDAGLSEDDVVSTVVHAFTSAVQYE